MKHYLFECVAESENEGEQFIVGANTFAEAERIALEEFYEVAFICELTEEEAEASGLDEY